MFVRNTKTDLILSIFMSRKIIDMYTFRVSDVISLITFVTNTIKDVPGILAKSVKHSSKIGHQDRHEDVPQKWRLANEMPKHGERGNWNLTVNLNK